MGILEKKKKAECELEAMIKDLKEKLDKYENDKKSANKGEKTRRESVHAKFEGEKKDLEEKVEKMKIQFEKAAIESRTAMSKLEQENTSAKQFVADAQSQLDKKDEELKATNNKLQLRDREVDNAK